MLTLQGYSLMQYTLTSPKIKHQSESWNKYSPLSVIEYTISKGLTWSAFSTICITLNTSFTMSAERSQRRLLISWRKKCKYIPFKPTPKSSDLSCRSQVWMLASTFKSWFNTTKVREIRMRWTVFTSCCHRLHTPFQTKTSKGLKISVIGMSMLVCFASLCWRPKWSQSVAQK